MSKPPFTLRCLGIMACLFGRGHTLVLAPDHDQVRLSGGRFDRSNPKEVRFDWPGCVIEAAFSGTTATILVSGMESNFNVYLDGKRLENLIMKSGVEKYSISGIGAGNHQLRLVKRTEGTWAVNVFRGIEVDASQTPVSLPAAPKYRIQFIGDSFTAGYGVESKSVNCADRKALDNADLTYAPLTAKAVNADYELIAISGKGMVHNYGDGVPISTEPMPLYYGRTLSSSATPAWKFSDFIPQVVTIALGTNDFSTATKPSFEQYSKGYRDLVAKVRANYPSAQIACLTFQSDTFQGKYVKAIVDSLKAAGDAKIAHVDFPSIENGATGCDYHPNEKANQAFAEILIPQMKAWLEANASPVQLPPRQKALDQKERRGFLLRRSDNFLAFDALGQAETGVVFSHPLYCKYLRPR
jgi:lysophospholipase L1-like esterase